MRTAKTFLFNFIKQQQRLIGKTANFLNVSDLGTSMISKNEQILLFTDEERI